MSNTSSCDGGVGDCKRSRSGMKRSIVNNGDYVINLIFVPKTKVTKQTGAVDLDTDRGSSSSLQTTYLLVDSN